MHFFLILRWARPQSHDFKLFFLWWGRLHVHICFLFVCLRCFPYCMIVIPQCRRYSFQCPSVHLVFIIWSLTLFITLFSSPFSAYHDAKPHLAICCIVHLLLVHAFVTSIFLIVQSALLGGHTILCLRLSWRGGGWGGAVLRSISRLRISPLLGAAFFVLDFYYFFSKTISYDNLVDSCFERTERNTNPQTGHRFFLSFFSPSIDAFVPSNNF